MELNNRQRHENLLRVIEELEDYAFYFIDADGQIVTWNIGAERIKGYKPSEIIGKNFRSFFTEEDRLDKRPDRLLMTASQFGKAYDEGWRVRKNGTTFWCNANLTAVHDNEGKVIGYGKLTRDLTDRKLAEAAAMLDARNKEVEQFTYIASHDLQEPLRTVSNYIQILEEDHSQQLNGTVMGYLQAIKDANERMRILVKSVLDYSRIGLHRQRELTDCKWLVNEVLADLQGFIDEKQAQVTVGDLPVINVYKAELRQLFQNLIHNAVKFHRSDVVPMVKIDCRKYNQTYTFTVTDNGLGIHPKHFDKIFQIFQRLHMEYDYEGYGIGLANCKKIVELHDGKIWVDSEPGKGSVFSFTIENYQI